ncbi:MAG: SDR family oxidoreductase [Anaerolineales bacterium]|nr:MAG: SDR family oxidoreductase [Anaerolineales bacterium]
MSTAARILVTGASGLLGSNFALQAAPRYEVVGITHLRPLHNPSFETLQADLLAPGAVNAVLEAAKPDWVVHCAALANIDACEKQPELARQLNAELSGQLARATAERSMRFLHVSTDAIFDGSKAPYKETDAPNPLSVYGKTKRMAELAVKAAHPKWLIVRPNLFGWSLQGNHSLAEFFYNNLSAGTAVKGFTDRLFSPLHVGLLAEILLELLEQDAHGIYHAGSRDSLSKYDFGVAIARRFGLDEQLVQPANTEGAGAEAPRSADLRLNVSRLTQALGRQLPSVADGIERLFVESQNGHRQTVQAMAAAVVKG